MSTGITIDSKPDVDIQGYFQNVAAEFDDFNFLLKKEDCDLSPYLFCPESFEDEEEMREYGATEDQIAYVKCITSQDYYPISDVYAKLQKAFELLKGYDEEMFDCGKDPYLMDFQELLDAIAPHADQDLEILLCRA